jgi:hypothetical protein
VPDPNIIALTLIAVMNAITAFLAYRTHMVSQSTRADVAKIEVATNSMKDALVEATGKASHAEGLAEGMKQGRQDARDEAVK